MDEMDAMTRAMGGNDIVDRLQLSRAAYRWLTQDYNPSVLEKLEQAEKSLKLIFNGQPLAVTTEKAQQDEQFHSLAYGSVSVRGKEILVSDPGRLVDLVEESSSVDITAYTNGDVDLCFGFRNLLLKVPED